MQLNVRRTQTENLKPKRKRQKLTEKVDFWSVNKVTTVCTAILRYVDGNSSSMWMSLHELANWTKQRFCVLRPLGPADTIQLNSFVAHRSEERRKKVCMFQAYQIAVLLLLPLIWCLFTLVSVFHRVLYTYIASDLGFGISARAQYLQLRAYM